MNNGKNDHDWFEILAGRMPADPDPVVKKQAEMLCEAIHASYPEVSENERELGKQALLARLQQEPEIPEIPSHTPTPEPPKLSWWRQPIWLGGGAFAAACLLVVMLLPIGTTTDLAPYASDNFADYPRYRGQLEIEQRASPDALHLVSNLVEALQKAAIPHRLSKAGTGWRVEYYIPQKMNEQIPSELSNQDLPETPGRWHIVEFKTE